MDCEHYRSLIASEHINTLSVIPISEIEELDHRFKKWGLFFLVTCSKLQVVNRLRSLKIINSDTIALCYDTCIPVRGLNLDVVVDYYLYKKAKGVFLYSYDSLSEYSWML